MGKTRLLAEIAKRAREAGMLTLAGGSYEQEGKLPYGPIHDALLDYIRAQPEEVLNIQLEGLIAELARIIPELRAHIPDIGEPPMSDPESQRLRLFSTVAQVLEHISQDSPLVLLLDDLHWADEATLQLLHFLLRQPVLSRVLMVGAYRREEVAEETALAQLTGEVERAPLTKTLTPSPLKEAELAALISERLGRSCSEDLVSTLHERSAGNPFFAVQMLRLLQQEGRLVETEAGWKLAGGTAVELPTEIRKTIARRLRGLPMEGREALTLGAVLGREFGHVQLEALWEGNERSLFAALDTALTAQVLTETEEGHAFAHPLLWEVVHDRVPAGRRMRLHQKAGLELEMLYGQ
jgi:predicted ATPase